MNISAANILVFIFTADIGGSKILILHFDVIANHVDQCQTLLIERIYIGGREAGMLIFEAVHRNPNAVIFWHIDNEYITQTRGTHKIEVSPSRGKHILTIEDEDGNIVKRRFRIVDK
jgi:membrane carboxypeptidase/penicillin-binding protein PbpC